MKSNKKLFCCDFISKFKYVILIPIILALVSIVIGAIFSFNLDYDFRKVDSFNVKFNTTVSESEYKILEENLYTIINNEGFSDYRVDRIGEGAQNGLIVKIADDNQEFLSSIDDLKVEIENKLLTNIDDQIESSVKVSTSDTVINLPKNVTNLILWSLLSVLCILIFVFFYNLIRYNLVSALSIVVSILIEIAMLTSLLVLARIPLNNSFVISYFVMIVLSIVITTLINNYIKSTLNVDKYNKFSNADRVYESINKNIKFISIFAIIVMIMLFAIMFFDLSLLYTVLSIIAGIIVSIFVSLIINFSLWTIWYKRDKDTRLKKRIETENKKVDTKTTDEKIVV